MWGRIIKIVFVASLYGYIAYFLRGCYLEERDIHIEPINQPTTWTYDMFTPILGERMYYVFIDGELNNEAELELQTQRITANSLLNKPDTTYTTLNVMRLPKGSFSTYYGRDDSGPETFVYRPLKATRGWVRVQIKLGQWINKDSLRTEPVFKSLKTYPISIEKKKNINFNHEIYP